MRDAFKYFLLPGLFLGIVIGILLARYIIRRRPCSNPLLFNVSADTTLFAFDLHGVVLTPDYAQIFSIIWHKFPKLLLIQFLAYPFGFYSLWKLLISQESTEQAFNEFCERHPQLKVLKPLLTELIAAQWLNIKSIKILEYLKEQGYTLVILSNIWPSSYKLLVKRYPIIHELFSAVYLPSLENHYAHKPERAFYEGFKHYLKQQGFKQEQIIFIENNDQNIKGAYRAGLHGLQVGSLDELVQKLKASQ